jgi:hypothetical protein
MSNGKGTEDFESYVRNLQLAVASTSIGSQLAPANAQSPIRRALILNPYGATVAQIGICRFRSTSSS